MEERPPLPLMTAALAVARCVGTTVVLLAQRRVHLPRGHVGRRLRFADGTSAVVDRETVVDGPEPEDSCVLVVEFRCAPSGGAGTCCSGGRAC
jgi:hypothetical protein